MGLGGGINTYGYAGGNSLSIIDYTGELFILRLYLQGIFLVYGAFFDTIKQFANDPSRYVNADRGKNPDALYELAVAAMFGLLTSAITLPPLVFLSGLLISMILAHFIETAKQMVSKLIDKNANICLSKSFLSTLTTLYEKDLFPRSVGGEAFMGLLFSMFDGRFKWQQIAAGCPCNQIDTAQPKKG